MALQGNLKDFSLTQLLNLINLASKTGTLSIEGTNDFATLTFKDGKLSNARMGKDDDHLAAILFRNKKITQAQYAILSGQYAGKSDKELGLLLVNAGYLTQKEILDCLKQYYGSIVHQLFTWIEGFFHFDLETLNLDNKIPIRMELEI